MYAVYVVAEVVLLFVGWVVPAVLLNLADRRAGRRVEAKLARLVRRGVVREEAGVLAAGSAPRRRRDRRVVAAVLEVGRGGPAAVHAELHAGRRQRRGWHIAAHCAVMTAIVSTLTIGAVVTAPGGHHHDPVLIVMVIGIQLGWLLPPTVLGVTERARYRTSSRHE